MRSHRRAQVGIAKLAVAGVLFVAALVVLWWYYGAEGREIEAYKKEAEAVGGPTVDVKLPENTQLGG